MYSNVVCFGFAELMRQNAPVTTKALGNHNAILRRAVNIHAGHVIEQEGDSWSVAFYRPVQAVAFCLQVKPHASVIQQFDHHAEIS